MAQPQFCQDSPVGRTAGGSRRALAALTVCAGLLVAAPPAAGDTGAARSPEFYAYLAPGGVPDRGAPVALPRPLAAADVARYRRIFALQEEADWTGADREIARLGDRLLLGHVLAQRYLHPTGWRAKFGELRDWLARHADHPDATRLHRLASRRQPAGSRAPAAPTKGYLNGTGDLNRWGPLVEYAEIDRSPAAVALRAEIRRDIRGGRPSDALRRLDSAHAAAVFDRTERAILRGDIAAGFYAVGNDKAALLQAERAAAEGGKWAAIAHWTAGLASWRLDERNRAASHFEAVARAETLSPWNRAGGAFWAARAHVVEGRPAAYTRWLRQAAHHADTFYGLLARRALGADPIFDWSLPPLTRESVAAIDRTPAGRRAFALLQLGEHVRAERELRKLYADGGEGLGYALLTLAAEHGLPGLAVRIAGMLAVERGETYYGALYPIPAWSLGDGRADRALVYAIARQESGFDPRAESPAGARGIMQLMPYTARVMTDGREKLARHELFDPELNLALGRRYIDHLIATDTVGDDVFRLVAAYNGGPGNLAKWQRRTDHRDDALLFIESLPSRETRIFIERVLANFWMYRMRLGQPTPSLDAVAAGRWPTYIAQDGSLEQAARHAPNR